MASAKNQRVGDWLRSSIGMKKYGKENEKFAKSHSQYEQLCEYVSKLQQQLEGYAIQLAQMTESSRNVSQAARGLHEGRNAGFKTCTAFHGAQEQMYSGQTGRIQNAFKMYILDPVVKWRKELENMAHFETEFNMVRAEHEHYRQKVDDLKAKTLVVGKKAEKGGDGKAFQAAEDRLDRNNKKYDEINKQYEMILKSCTECMDKAWADRLRMVNGTLFRLIKFQEALYAEQLTTILGVDRIMHSERGQEWADGQGIDVFLPMVGTKHMEGFLVRKTGLVYRTRMWCRLVDRKLECYSLRDGEDSLLAGSEEPYESFDVSRVERVSELNLKVWHLESRDGVLVLTAPNSVMAERWFVAFKRAAVWDSQATSNEVAFRAQESRVFVESCKSHHIGSIKMEDVEKSLGVASGTVTLPMVTSAPPPVTPAPPSEPAAAPTEAAGGGASNGGGGGGNTAEPRPAAASGGATAAGIAPGGEAGVPSWGPWPYHEASDKSVGRVPLAGAVPGAEGARAGPAEPPQNGQAPGGNDRGGGGGGGEGNGGKKGKKKGGKGNKPPGMLGDEEGVPELRNKMENGTHAGVAAAATVVAAAQQRGGAGAAVTPGIPGGPPPGAHGGGHAPMPMMPGAHHPQMYMHGVPPAPGGMMPPNMMMMPPHGMVHTGSQHMMMPPPMVGAGPPGGTPPGAPGPWNGLPPGDLLSSSMSGYDGFPMPRARPGGLTRHNTVDSVSAPMWKTPDNVMMRPTPGSEVLSSRSLNSRQWPNGPAAAAAASSAPAVASPSHGKWTDGAATAGVGVAGAAAAGAAAGVAAASTRRTATGDGDVGGGAPGSSPEASRAAPAGAHEATSPASAQPAQPKPPTFSSGSRVVPDVPQSVTRLRRAQRLRRGVSVGPERSSSYWTESDGESKDDMDTRRHHMRTPPTKVRSERMSSIKRRASADFEEKRSAFVGPEIKPRVGALAPSKVTATEEPPQVEVKATASDAKASAPDPSVSVPEVVNMAVAGGAAVAATAAAEPTSTTKPPEPAAAVPSVDGAKTSPAVGLEEGKRLQFPRSAEPSAATQSGSGSSGAAPAPEASSARQDPAVSVSGGPEAPALPSNDAAAGAAGGVAQAVVPTASSAAPIAVGADDSGGSGPPGAPRSGSANFDLTVTKNGFGDTKVTAEDPARELNGVGADKGAAASSAPKGAPAFTVGGSDASGDSGPGAVPVSNTPSAEGGKAPPTGSASFTVQNVAVPAVKPSGVEEPSKSGGEAAPVAHSESNGTVSTAAQVKVFRRLCATRAPGVSEAETGDAGGGGGEAGVSRSELTLSFDQLMAWEEIQELLHYKALTEDEVKTVWKNALRQQDERTIASTAKAHGDIWGGDTKVGKKSEAIALPREPSNALTQRGFTLLVKLIEELQYEKDLQRDQGVSLVGPVRVV